MVPSRSKKTAGTRVSVEAIIYLVERDVAPRAQINSVMPSESLAVACLLGGSTVEWIRTSLTRFQIR